LLFSFPIKTRATVHRHFPKFAIARIDATILPLTILAFKLLSVAHDILLRQTLSGVRHQNV
jgi:hypothetical protein